MNLVTRALHRVDASQRRITPAAVAFAVVKKFGDDRGGNLAALITYYGFLSVFPLLLLLVTLLGVFAGGSPSTVHRIEHSALDQFPVIGTQLARNIHSLHRNSVIGLILGVVGLLYGAQGASQAGQFAMAEVWAVPPADRPGYIPRLLRSLAITGAVGTFLLVSTALAGISSFSGSRAPWERGLGFALTVVVDIALYLVAFRVLTPGHVGTRSLVPGAVAGGIGWTVLQVGGSLLVDHTLRHASQVYGFFGIVLGLLAWIYLGAQLTIYCAEANVVVARHLWPRSLAPPPLTPADERVYASIVRGAARRPELDVSIRPVPPPAGAGADSAGASPARRRPGDS